MGEETWPKDVVRSKGITYFLQKSERRLPQMSINSTYRVYLGEETQDGPRRAICADCGKAPQDGLLIHMKPEFYAIDYKGEVYFLERHIGVSCGCAARRGLVIP